MCEDAQGNKFMVKAFNSSENFLKLEEVISPLFPFIQGPDQKPPQVCHFFSWFMDFSASFKEHIYKSEACSLVIISGYVYDTKNHIFFETQIIFCLKMCQNQLFH